jgi:hypothetical protein
LHDLLDLLLHARFASDRRKAFLWIKLASSVGKGFLFQGVLGVDGLGLVAPVSVKEIERAMEGAPLGIAADMLYRSWVLWIDEFKSSKSEIKQLNNDIWVTPKNQLRSRVQTYAKVFTSAEGVDSLAGSEGVEAQFSERFSYLDNDGISVRLDDRPVFKAVGRMVYRTVMANCAAAHLNAGVERMRALGRFEAAKVADAWLDAWHAKHGIGQSFESLDDSVQGYAEEISQLIKSWARHQTGDAQADVSVIPGLMKSALSASVQVIVGSRNKKACQAGEVELLAIVKRPAALVKAWVRYAIDQSQQVLVSHKSAAIAKAIDPDAVSMMVHVYRFNGVKPSERITAKGLCLTVKDVQTMASERSEFDNVVPIQEEEP